MFNLVQALVTEMRPSVTVLLCILIISKKQYLDEFTSSSVSLNYSLSPKNKKAKDFFDRLLHTTICVSKNVLLLS